jgi:hypothetical protein
MPLKNKDGTPYQLNKPNPLTKGQLEMDNLILHNCQWQIDKIEKGITVSTPQNQGFKLPDKEPNFTLPDPEPEPELNIPEPESKPQIPEPEIEVSAKLRDKTIIFHCLPVNIKVYKDELYGEEHEINEFGEKFKFEGFIVEDDMYLKFWTNREMKKDYIVYPSKYLNNQPLKEFSWYKVDEIEEKTGGYLCRGIPTTINPDFT